MSENKRGYDEELDYYKSKCASLEEGLFKADREQIKLEKENEQLQKENRNLRFEMSMYEQKIEELEKELNVND